MKQIIYFLQLIISTWTLPIYNPVEHIFQLAYPYSLYGTPDILPYSNNNNRYLLPPSPPPQLPSLGAPQSPPIINDYLQSSDFTGNVGGYPEIQPNFNILAELPYSVSNHFSVLPMYIMSNTKMNMVSQGHITAISKDRPLMTIKDPNNATIKCTPAVRMVLEKPIIVGDLYTKILFPTDVQIIYDGYRIPIRIGAVIAPVLPDTFISPDHPVAIRVVYAIPTKPIKITITIDQDNDDTPKQSHTSSTIPLFPSTSFQEQSNTINEQKKPIASNSPPKMSGFGALSNKPDYINNDDAVVMPEIESVVIEREPVEPPKNVTIVEFPDSEAVPQIDTELENRNPPQILSPSGIIQSTQPQIHEEPFHNDKESPYLETLREEAKKKIKKI